jgi:hypothetical protein
MKASELRIGNYYMFADNDGIVCRQVKEIKHNQFGLLSDYDGVNFENCRPLNLTEDWLFKFGFKGTEGYYYDSEIGAIEFYYEEEILVCDIYNYRNESVEYVHQLQNIFFALTNKELKIN